MLESEVYRFTNGSYLGESGYVAPEWYIQECNTAKVSTRTYQGLFYKNQPR